MKRLIFLCLSVFLLVGPSHAITIEGATLYGGNGDSFQNWAFNGQAWDTYTPGFWVLGVSEVPGSDLLNQPDTTISGLPLGCYYLYAEPTVLGNNPRLDIRYSDNSLRMTIFEIAGAPGSGTPWAWKAGNADVTLGWAQGFADLVRPGEVMTSNGVNDFYLVVGPAGYQAPLPGAVWLLGTGLLTLAGLQRRCKA